MKVDIRETPEGPQSPVLTIVLDGYNAPVSAGQVGWVWVGLGEGWGGRLAALAGGRGVSQGG